jgi:hypothetical protein
MAQSEKKKKFSLDQLFQLVEPLSAEEQEELRMKLNRNAEVQSAASSESHSFLDWRIDINDLATQQGVQASNSIEQLKGDFWPPNEDLEEFSTTIRQWRHDNDERR